MPVVAIKGFSVIAKSLNVFLWRYFTAKCRERIFVARK